MSRFNTPDLESKYYGLFQHEPYQEPCLTGRGAISRVILACFWMVIGVILFSVLPSRHPAQEPLGWVVAAVFVLRAGVPYLVRTWKAWHYGPASYRLVGEFEVREKDHLFSTCWVRLLPGNNFHVQVEQKLYERLHVGSRLRLIYTADGEQVSVALLP